MEAEAMSTSQPVEDAAASSPPKYEPCEVCGTPLVMQGGCIYCRAVAAEGKLTNISIWGEDEWMRRLAALELEESPGPRLHVLGFYQELDGRSQYTFSSRPQIIFRPELLTVAPECAAYGMLVDFKVGNRSQLVNADPIPLSVFSPTAWASIEMMRDVMGKLAFDTASIAQDITMHIDLTPPAIFDPLVQEAYAAMGRPIPRAFKAALWGRSVDEGVPEPVPNYGGHAGPWVPPYLAAGPVSPPMLQAGHPMGAPSPFEGFGALPREAELAAILEIRRTPAFHKLVARIEKQARKKLGR